ncbi:MAG TPA: PilZ domain-containing protein, partial [Candidatus Acidoferrum sp.]|nr:PilZ domain-containing protein [Candidatus Acidoferrum sp.]
MTLKTERRTQLRKRPLSLVYVELPPANGGMMRDLSEQGFSLRAMMPLRPSEKIPFSFALESSARIDGEAIVLRVEDGGHVAALEFAGLSAHFRDQIRRWLDKFDEPFSPESEPAQPSPSMRTSLTELRSKIRVRKQPSEAPPVAENAPPPASPSPQAIAEPPNVEPTPPPLASTPEIAPPTPPPSVEIPPEPEPQPTLLSPVVASAPSASPMVSTPPEPELPPAPPAVEPPQQPPPTVMALPKRFPPRPREKQPAPTPAVSPTTVEQSDAPALPPLLKLSSVRPAALPVETHAEPVAPVEIPKPAAEPPEKIQISVPKPEPPVATETRIPVPTPAPAAPPRRLIPPPLEPLSSFEGEPDSDNPNWMDNFTLGRAVGIMLFLTLFAGSYVYHRELGQAIIWLGHQIAGDDSPESSKVARPEIPPAMHATPPAIPAPRSVETPAPGSEKSSE